MGTVIRGFLALRRMTARSLAVDVGMTESKMSERLNGKTRFRADEVRQIAQALGVRPGDLYQSPEDVMERLAASGYKSRERWADKGYRWSDEFGVLLTTVEFEGQMELPFLPDCAPPAPRLATPDNGSAEPTHHAGAA